MKIKKIYFIAFFLLLTGVFIFLEWQISVEEKVIKKEPVAHIAIGR